ncbi:MAG: imidazoleglycerol-phosphate dehydratase HisB [Polyangiaceae bacterium]|jgi:imidazoleglycerol-phosphate dehydratase
MGRVASVSRETKETKVEVTANVDGSGRSDIETPLPFLSHMVDQLARHGLIDLTVRARGDTEIDGHHTTEDVGLVIGQCVAKAIGDKAGLVRYGWATLPMDEARATCAVDLSGRTHFVWEVPLPAGAKLGTWDVELAPVFFEAFARGAQCNLHIVLHRGDILHHIVEVSFKALARALREALRVDPRATGVPSTKGDLTD